MVNSSVETGNTNNSSRVPEKLLFSVAGIIFQYGHFLPSPIDPSKSHNGWTIGVLGFDSWWGLGVFLFITASRTALEPTQPPTQWVPGALFLGVKRPGREADHSPPSSAEIKE